MHLPKLFHFCALEVEASAVGCEDEDVAILIYFAGLFGTWQANIQTKDTISACKYSYYISLYRSECIRIFDYNKKNS